MWKIALGLKIDDIKSILKSLLSSILEPVIIFG
jgi:hypothetical protein